ncbi:MAG: lytic transglycosylase domain-containing protein [Deltaproteobacteria bacterium]|nr:lytic transglycosylase domain-containing protein [Deltaproteobacteria bacterium]
MKRGSTSWSRVAAAVTTVLALAPRAAHGAEVVIPIHLDHELIQEVLAREVFTGPDGTANVWKDGAGCSYMTLASPRVGSLGVRLHLVANGEAKVGKKIGSSCVTALEWKGTIDVTEEVRVEPDQPVVHFRVAEASIHGAGAEASGSDTLERWVKLYVQPKLENVTVDLRPTLAELKALIPTVLPHGDPRVTEQLVDSFRVLGAEADSAGLVTKLRLELPDRPVLGTKAASAAVARSATVDGAGADEEGVDPSDAGGAQTEPALTGEELARWDAAWQRWDAFITFVAKHVASDAQSRELRDALLGVLIDARQDVAEILVPSQPDGPDPLRSLFVNTWARLVPVLRSVSASMPGSGALRYASFVSAGDALTAIDALGPQIGLDLSADGLRRMARILTPQLAEDPLVYGEQVDPDLRRIFGFGTPLLLPGEKPVADASSPPALTEETSPEPLEPPEPQQEAVDLDRLAGWAPSRGELDEYLPLVRALLLRAADQSAARYEVPPPLKTSFRNLVLTTAWQESCWRQWTTGRDGVLRPMRSRAGAVGVMQVLERAWRGFYDLRTLRNDFDYNARAGVEILARYLTEHAISDPRDAIADPELLARTTYALYHAGPKGRGRADRQPAHAGADPQDRRPVLAPLPVRP